ncbi:hypothetical protein SNK03_003006 [Fusarium graminearum]
MNNKLHGPEQHNRQFADSKMAFDGSDPFTKLPPEIRLYVLTSIECTSTISRLIKASPTMLQQYLAFKKHIIRKVIGFDQDEMQDAMAIILFPGKRIRTKRQAAPVRVLLRNWSNRQLPDPIENKDDRLISRLNKLHKRIMLLVEDYITKATAFFPPREYLCLPQGRHSSEGHLMFKGVKVAPRFNSTNLATFERKRFVKAFLMHELVCKMKNIIDLPVGFRRRKVSNGDIETLNCVHAYYCSLYGAIFAQCSDAQLPSNPTGGSFESELQFPDTFYFDTNSHTHKVGLFSFNMFGGDPPDYSDGFSRLGLDHLADFLRYDMAQADDREALKVLIQDSTFDKQIYCWKTQLASIFHRTRRAEDSCDSAMYKQLSLDRDSELRYDIGRQRAWAFFDDSRLYPQDTIERPIFPSDSFLKKQSIEKTFTDDWFRNPVRVRAWRQGKLSSEERIKTHLAKAGII